MTVRGHYDLPGFTYDSFLNGAYLYAADDGLGHRILGISDPDNPAEVAAYNPPGGSISVSGYGATSGMAFREGYIYSADFWSGVSIIDVHHPATSVLVNTYDTPGDVRDIEIAGDYAYLAETFQGLRILNLQNPEQPEEVALVKMEWAWEVEVIGEYIFVRNPNGIKIMVDVSDPANPISVEVSPQKTGFEPKAGNYLYPYFVEIGVHRIDISDPLHPVDTGFLAAPYYYNGDIQFINETVYITDIGGSGFQMEDISDPANPSILHIWDVGFSGWFSVKGNYLYALNADSVAVIDISDPDNPIVLATYQDNGLFPFMGADDFQIIPVGNFIYAGIRSSGLAIFYYDVSTSKVFIPTITR
jgi:hypothetical protein